MAASVLSSRAVIGMFYERLEQGIGLDWAADLSMFFDKSTQAEEEYKWIGPAPTMREWKGGRQPVGLSDAGQKIKNTLYESTLEIDIYDLQFDQTGQLKVRIDEHAAQANTHWIELLSDKILNGAAGVCYDSHYFFDTDHEGGDSGVQSNKVSVDISALPCNQHGSVTAPSPEEMELLILYAIQTTLGFKNEKGKPANRGAKSFRVMVPVSLMMSAAAAIVNPVLTSGKTNTIVTSDFEIKLITNGDLTWTDRFSVFRADGYTKPFIRQQREDVKVAAVAEGSELEFYRHKHHYGISAYRGVGYGQWRHACQIILI
ncbi:MAG: Mu-like prophage major head subunit gpT family protein [Candidatus Eisenbacteria bacterium]|nr:Mu-like prophage major head subunit gpT family protein [Candidatus Eisenbacteria bacterium]